VDAEQLRQLARDPETAASALRAWLDERPGLGIVEDETFARLRRDALFVRELDRGRPLAAVARTLAPPATYPTWGLRRTLRFVRQHRLVTRRHVGHLRRLRAARRRAARREQDVHLHGMSFLERDVELTAPQGLGRLVVGPWSWIGHGVALRANAGRVTIGPKVVLGGGCIINAFLDVSIGEGCLFADDVHVTDFDHRTDRLDVPIKDQGIVASPVRIGPDVWVGRGATILRGVDIGRGAVIGAHAVVTRDVPPFAVAVGAPARVVRSRLPEGVDPWRAAAALDAGRPSPVTVAPVTSSDAGTLAATQAAAPAVAPAAAPEAAAAASVSREGRTRGPDAPARPPAPRSSPSA
jgi:acetyltransferase-like isoleucine patch superfamily enzyme